MTSRSSKVQNWHRWYRRGMRKGRRLPLMACSDSASTNQKVFGHCYWHRDILSSIPANYRQILSRLNWLLGFKLHWSKSASTERLQNQRSTFMLPSFPFLCKGCFWYCRPNDPSITTKIAVLQPPPCNQCSILQEKHRSEGTRGWGLHKLYVIFFTGYCSEGWQNLAVF